MNKQKHKISQASVKLKKKIIVNIFPSTQPVNKFLVAKM